MSNRYSLIIPVYNNADSIPNLMQSIGNINHQLNNQLEVVFVVDGSPDQSFTLLKNSLPEANFTSQLILLSRNFGAFSAIRAGLKAASGNYFAVMAADLQEPPELITQFFSILTQEPVDVVFGIRKNRRDPFLQKFLAKTYWMLYKKLIISDMPPGGIDIFGCNAIFKEHLLALQELNSSLIGLAFWLGFKRKMIPYERRDRAFGKSAWSLKKRIKYAMDSSFSFSDLPIKLLLLIGILGVLFSTLATIIVMAAKFSNTIQVPGYAATIITIVFFAALNSMGLGIIGSYVWRAYENTKARPQSIIMSSMNFNNGIKL